jgi:hypothetical protein
MKEMGGIFQDTNHFEGHFILENIDSPKKRRVFLSLEKI